MKVLFFLCWLCNSTFNIQSAGTVSVFKPCFKTYFYRFASLTNGCFVVAWKCFVKLSHPSVGSAFISFIEVFFDRFHCLCLKLCYGCSAFCNLLCISSRLKSILGLKSKQLLLLLVLLLANGTQSCQNAAASTMRLRSSFCADSPSAAVWNCRFEQNSISIIQHSLLIGDYKEPFEQCGFSSSDTRRREKRWSCISLCI